MRKSLPPEQEEAVKNQMQGIARALKERLPPNFGFICLVFPFGDIESRCNYVSNAERIDAINTMKEWLIKCGAAEDWMKHL